MNPLREYRDKAWKIGNDLKTISITSYEPPYYMLIQLRIQRNILNELVNKFENEMKGTHDDKI